jgi:flavin reductase (DIM6/NTAB) family NADH-FMN oxidoreductase RutF
MFYDAVKNDHGLRFDPFKAIVAPRPIGWVTSMNAKGDINLAPYSFFNGINSRPALVMFSSEGLKDSVSFIAETGEFVCNLATWDLREAVNLSSATLPRGMSEFETTGLGTAPSRLVKPPRVADAPAALECKLLKIDEIFGLDGRSSGAFVTFGEVVGIHIGDEFIRDGRFDMTKAKTIARCGYMDYAVVEEVFQMRRPG